MGWHDGTHDIFPWFRYTISTLRSAYREFEQRATCARPRRGSKTELVNVALEAISGTFGIADIEQRCPNVSRDLIRRVMNRWRKEGHLTMLTRGRDARWEKPDRQ